jgi:hypothetical protein
MIRPWLSYRCRFSSFSKAGEYAKAAGLSRGLPSVVDRGYTRCGLRRIFLPRLYEKWFSGGDSLL